MLPESATQRAEQHPPEDSRIPCPRLIELVGVAGTGKSTLLKAMSQRNPRIQELELPSKLVYLPTMLRVVFRWLPLYLLKYRQGRWFTWEEMRKLGYLDTWLRYSRSQSKAKDIIAVLDPGSICWLVALRDFGPELTKDAQFQRWWEERMDQWARALDAIVWIEAPIELSLKRVMGRDEEHEAKRLPTDAALEEFDRYRLSYIKLIPEMARRGHARVFRYRSDQISTEQMANEIFTATDFEAD